MSGAVHIAQLSDAVVLLEIDNPPANPLGAQMREALIAALDRAEASGAVRCLILTGRGRAFCSGDDLKSDGATQDDLAGFGRVLDRVEAARVPVIAAVNGWCLGGGFELALCCDIRLASTAAIFTAAGVNVGLVASTYRLPRLIGQSRAMSMLLTGLPHDAETAERYGLVTGVYSPDDLRPAAIALADRIASRAPLSVEAVKRTARRAMDLSPDEANALWGEEQRVLRRSNDHKAAVEAFRARRDPTFTRS